MWAIRDSRSNAEVLALLREAATQNGWPTPNLELVKSDIEFLLSEVQTDVDALRSEIVGQLRAKITQEQEMLRDTPKAQMQAWASLQNSITKDIEVLSKVSGAMVTRMASDITTHDDNAKKFNALRAALGDILVTFLSIAEATRIMKLADRIVEGDSTARDELRQHRVIDISVNAGHERHRITEHEETVAAQAPNDVVHGEVNDLNVSALAGGK